MCPQRLGILVGGGPAPGINGVIHAATIQARVHGLDVYGIYDGFKHLAEGKIAGKPLTIADVSRIHVLGGSILRTARANPTKSEEALRNSVCALAEAGVTLLLGIGGDDTAYSVYRVARYAQEQMGVPLRSVHVPKTIDNDLPLPEGIPTFGYETARDLGSRIVTNIMEDAATSQHWFLVVSMGRKTGHLALGIGKASGATVTVIPEEWRGRPILLAEVVDILVTSALRRVADNRPHGVALIAEGVAEHLVPEDKAQLSRLVDDHGNLRHEEIDFADYLKSAMAQELRGLGIDLPLRDKELGFELRCAPPNAYDIDYTRSLGQAAVDFLMDGGTNATISLQGGRVVAIPAEQMMDPATGRTVVRSVDIDSFTYRSAYNLMIRLKPEDADDAGLWARLAAASHLPVGDFTARYGYLAGIAPRPF
jgi:ATP-dependent phosphofructokinase / diphosphate-dependent phosphofructokinase